jgi:exo-1,4-beta-D-glucosaminidase
MKMNLSIHFGFAPLHRFKIAYLTILFLSVGFQLSFSIDLTKLQPNELLLEKGWFINQSSATNEKGNEISKVEFQPKNWIPANIPATVLGALVDAGVYKDVFFGENLKSIPTAQFAKSWWYRKEFEVNDRKTFETARVCFEGINYYANIWVNGILIASADTIEGCFNTWQFEITKHLLKGKNVLAVEVFPPKLLDFYMAFADWNPAVPDKNMGIFRPVKIKFTGKVSLDNIYVKTKVNLKTYDEANLAIEAKVINHSNEIVETKIEGQIENIRFQQTIKLKAFETKEITFDSSNVSALKMKNPRLWWPAQYGKPNLYTVNILAKENNYTSDIQSVDFGVREVGDYLDSRGNRGYTVNGKKIQIRGAGWTDEIFLRENEKNLEAQVEYVQSMNLNTIRCEGFWGSSQKLYDLCDKNGILMMAGWNCVWEWPVYNPVGIAGEDVDEFGRVKTEEQMALVATMFKNQVLWLRNHPSIFVWLYGSDRLPRPILEKKYIDLLKVIDPTRPTLGAIANITSELTGPTGLSMQAPYQYVTPNYYYSSQRLTKSYGFSAETGPGPQIPIIESIKEMIPKDKLWPINEVWNYHCAVGSFNNLNVYNNALNARYGEASSLEDYIKKAQLSNYETIRSMFEAYTVNKNNVNGVIHWMLNSAWPKLYWQLYDYYLSPSAAFFGTKEACKPLNVIYNYDDNAIYISNNQLEPLKLANIEVKVFDINSNEVLSMKTPFEISTNESKKIVDIPALKSISKVYFIALKIIGNDGKEMARNFYWLSTKPDVLDEGIDFTQNNPNKSFADFKLLGSMTRVKVQTSVENTSEGGKNKFKVKLKNNSGVIAFFIEMKLKDEKSGKLITPVFWEDNYVSLLPGEEREVKVSFNKSELKNDKPIFDLDGWNVERELIK